MRFCFSRKTPCLRLSNVEHCNHSRLKLRPSTNSHPATHGKDGTTRIAPPGTPRITAKTAIPPHPNPPSAPPRQSPRSPQNPNSPKPVTDLKINYLPCFQQILLIDAKTHPPRIATLRPVDETMKDRHSARNDQKNWALVDQKTLKPLHFL